MKKIEGKNNIALGAVLKVWHNYRDMYGDPEEYNEDNTDSKIPDLNELEALRAHTDLSKLIIDDQSNTVFIEDPLMSIDVGGVAKGYATELVATKLEEAGVTDFAINAGGNVRVSGHSYGSDDKKRPWNTGIQDPFISTNPSVANIRITSGSLVSSGNYQRYYWYDGKKYSHIIDNDTLFPSFLYVRYPSITKTPELLIISAQNFFSFRLMKEENSPKNSTLKSYGWRWMAPFTKPLIFLR